jgi:hypothetical protein
VRYMPPAPQEKKLRFSRVADRASLPRSARIFQILSESFSPFT